ncbi:MAG: orotidine-5'-phosphate decarboxylase [Halothiobacillaceae bacterium]
MIDHLPRVYVALDMDNAADADRLTEALAGSGCGLKVGKELFTAVGPDWVRRHVDAGFSLFLDLKYHDIPNTVARACRVAAGMGVDLLNVHAAGGGPMMSAALAAVRAVNPRTHLIAVTVLTSMDEQTMHATGVSGPVADQVERLGRLAAEAGLDGVVCSAREASAMREVFGPRGMLVTPGIRPSWAATDDQHRVMTPAEAISAGASSLVIGRPITGADDPFGAWMRIHEEIEQAQAGD